MGRAAVGERFRAGQLTDLLGGVGAAGVDVLNAMALTILDKGVKPSARPRCQLDVGLQVLGLSAKPDGDDWFFDLRDDGGGIGQVGVFPELIGAGNDKDIDLVVDPIGAGAPGKVGEISVDLFLDGMDEGQIAVVMPDLPIEGREVRVRIEAGILGFPEQAKFPF